MFSFLSGSLASLASVTSFNVTPNVVSRVQPMAMLSKSFFGASLSGMQKEGTAPLHCSFLWCGRHDNSSFLCHESHALSAPMIERRSGELSGLKFLKSFGVSCLMPVNFFAPKWAIVVCDWFI